MANYTIDKIEYGGNTYNLSPNVVYATCSTAASTAAKVATITSGTLNSLNAGDQVIVKFTYANGKASPTLKVGSTDAKSIMRYGTTAPSTSAATSWNAGSCVWFVYDGTYWQMAGWINSTYTVTDKKLEIGAVTSGTTYYPIVGTNSTTAATRQYDSTGFEYNVSTGTAEDQGGAGIRLGNSIATGTAGNKKGFITIYGTGSNSSTLYGPSGGSSSYNVWLPEKGGIIALTTDIPDVSGKIDTAGTGLSKSGTTLNHSNSVTAQTTQAVYPIKIDAQGHISAYGSAVTIPTVPANIVNTITTTAGTHTTITSSTGAVSFNVPTKTSHLTNDSGFITSAGVTSITTTAGAHTAITSSTGAVSFNVPTKTSHLTNDSGFITSYADEKVKLTSQSTSGTYPLIFGPTSITSNSTYQGYYNTGITVNPSTKTVTATTFVGALTGTASGNLTSSSTLDATKLSGTIPAGCYTDTNTTYALSGALSSHKFTSTLTAGGSGSGTSTSDFTLAAGTGITITDDTSNRKMTIACSVTNTDTKVSTAAVTSGTTYYPTLGSDTTSAATKYYDKNGISYVGTSGSGSTSGEATLTLGNNVAGSSGKCGYLDIYGIGQYKTTLRLGSALTANRWINLPDKNGTIALTSDVVPKPSDDGSFGWVLKYITANSTVWDAPDIYEVGVMEDLDNPGTYILTSLPDDVRNAIYSGQKLVLRLVLNSATIGTHTINTDYIFTNCEVEQHYDEGTDISYMTARFQGRMNLDEVTITIYLDETESLYTDGELNIEKKIAAHAGNSGSEGIVVGGWKICWGTISLNTNSASGSGTYAAPYYVDSASIALNYSGTPYVWCQVMGGWTGARYATPYDITGTGFTIRLYASAKNSTNTQIRWLSIGSI